MKAEPNRVKMKNLMAAYRRVSTSFRNPGIFRMVRSPQMPIMKYMGNSTNSKKMKNSTRSRATKVPFMPVARISIRIKKALGLRGSSQCCQE